MSQGGKYQRERKELIHIDLFYKRLQDIKEKMTLASHLKQSICSCTKEDQGDPCWVFQPSLLESWRQPGRGLTALCDCVMDEVNR